MKNVYPVFFTETDKCVLIEVPDLEILTEGNNLYDAIIMARDAVGLKCMCMEDDSIDIPVPSKLDDLKIEESTFSIHGKTFVSLIDVNTDEYRKKIL